MGPSGPDAVGVEVRGGELWLASVTNPDVRPDAGLPCLLSLMMERPIRGPGWEQVGLPIFEPVSWGTVGCYLNLVVVY